MLNTNIKVRVSKALISDINNICQWKFPKRIVRQSCVCVCVEKGWILTCMCMCQLLQITLFVQPYLKILLTENCPLLIFCMFRLGFILVSRAADLMWLVFARQHSQINPEPFKQRAMQAQCNEQKLNSSLLGIDFN